MSRKKKKVCGAPKSAAGRVAKALSISLYPKHFDVLELRAKELNVPKSLLMQLLLELERERGFLRPEVAKRVILASAAQQAHNPGGV